MSSRFLISKMFGKSDKKPIKFYADIELAELLRRESFYRHMSISSLVCEILIDRFKPAVDHAQNTPQKPQKRPSERVSDNIGSNAPSSIKIPLKPAFSGSEDPFDEQLKRKAKEFGI